MKQKGFSLIELMIAIAVLGIITAVAYPSYTNYVRDARRAEVQGAMLEAAQWMERQYTVNGSYGITESGGSFSGGPDFSAFYSAGHYALTISAGGNSSYTIQAAAQGGQTKDICDTLTVDSIGRKQGSLSGTAVTSCWD